MVRSAFYEQRQLVNEVCSSGQERSPRPSHFLFCKIRKIDRQPVAPRAFCVAGSILEDRSLWAPSIDCIPDRVASRLQLTIPQLFAQLRAKVSKIDKQPQGEVLRTLACRKNRLVRRIKNR